MKNRKTRSGLRRMLLTLALVLVVAVASVGGTIAWLTDETESVVNTFTVGDINIELNETTNDYKMVPGNTINKDPKVTVKAGSEACWLFVKIEKSSNLDTFITYEVADGWAALTGQDGVYYREVSAVTGLTDTTFSVLKNDKVTVNTTVTKTMMEGLKVTGATRPTLTFTAYAVQKDNVNSAADAWTKLDVSSSTEGGAVNIPSGGEDDTFNKDEDGTIIAD